MLIALASAIGNRTLQGQTISFLSRAPGIDEFSAVAADASGVYVFWNAGVRKYDSRGSELWTREFSAPVSGIISATADATGVYMIEYGGDAARMLVRKYSAVGDELWARQLGFSAPGGLAVDTTGVYVTGRDYPPSATYLRKYSLDGAELWTTQWGDPSNLDNPHAVAVDSTGVYVFGIAGRFGPFGAASFSFVRKWDQSGNPLWTRQFSDLPRAFAAADPTGFYLVAGVESDHWFNFLRKYDSGGNELWSRKIEPFSELGNFLAADVTGVYLGGKMPVTYEPYRPFSVLPGQCRSGSGGDSFVRKYNPAGDEVWTRQFGLPDSAWARALAAAAGGVYVVGQEGTAQVRDDFEHFDAFAPANPTRGAFLVKLDQSTAVVADAKPRIFPGCVVNAASYVGGGVAPGEIVTIFGSAMGPPEVVPRQLIEDRRLATTLADTRILFNGAPAPLMYVSDKQSQAIVPYAVADRSSVDIQVEYKGVRSEAITVPVLPSRPGIFSQDGSGQGQGAILNEDGSPNSPANPARRGSVITLSATGGGEAALGVEDGQILSDVLPQTSLPVSVWFDLANNEFQVTSKPAEVLYAGGQSGSVAGLLQLKVRVPANAVATGAAVPFLLIIGSHWTVHQVTLALR
jgi:uncharacterized protein (TIGR03437 family)